MIDFGKKLKNARLGMSLSLQEVSERSKIRIHILEAMEEGNFTILPAIYMKSFIKTYSDIVGLVPEPIVTDTQKNIDNSNKKLEDTPIKKTKKKFSFHSDDKDIEHKSSFDTSMANEKPNPLGNILVYVSIGLIAILLFYFGFFSSIFQVSENRNVVAYNQEPSTEDTSVIGDSETDLFANFTPQESDSIILEARAKEKTWLRIIVDGKKAEEVLMHVGTIKRWSAKEYFQVTQGNVGGIEYYRNNRILEPFGARGSVVRNIKITKTDILNITKGEQDSIKRLYFTKKKPKKKKRKPILIQPANFDENFLNKKKQE